MKFEAKYETQRKITDGLIETFVALDIATRQNVVVHIFDCPARTGAPRSEQDLLATFAGFGVEPAGMVIDAGTFDGKVSAYLATTWPGDRALEDWRRTYENMVSRAGRPIDALGGTKPSSPEAATVAWPEKAPQAPDFTAQKAGPAEGGTEPLFSTSIQEATASNPRPSSARGSNPSADASGFFRSDRQFTPSESVENPRHSGGEFTQLFSTSKASSSDGASSLPHGEGVSASDRRAESAFASPKPKVSASLMESVQAGQFNELFFKDIESKAVEDVAPGSERKGNTPDLSPGEFTSLFQGPFSGERPAAIPKISVEPVSQHESAGEYTMLFGPAKSDAPEVAHSSYQSNPAIPAEPPGSSTKVFEPNNTFRPPERAGIDRDFVQDRQPANVATPGQPSFVSPPQNPVPYSSGAVHEVPSEPVFPAGENLPAVSLNEAAGNATRVFSRPEPLPVVEQAASRSGPSDWTMFQKKESAVPISSEELKAQPSADKQSWGGFAGGVAAQAAPPIPTWQAPVVQAPVPPQMPYSMPQPSIPAAPAAPALPLQSPATPPKPVSYWPLIIVLNVLFILAVLLILYFALKH